METMDESNRTAEELAQELGRLVKLLQQTGRYDLMLKAISVPVVEQLRIESCARKAEPARHNKKLPLHPHRL